MRILLIEDDEILADHLVTALTQQRYIVDAIADGQAGLNYAQSTAYDLILMDVGLPGLNGIRLCERLRQEGCATPILLMTAKDAPDERVRGLDAGADDHLTKPLNLEELHARIRALLRRGEVAAETLLEVGPLKLDPAACQVVCYDTPLKLTPKEYNLLELFLRNPARVFSRSQIVEHLWTFDDPPLEDSVKAHIKGLRRKLKEAGAADWVENVYGIGYRLKPEPELANPATLASETGTVKPPELSQFVTATGTPTQASNLAAALVTDPVMPPLEQTTDPTVTANTPPRQADPSTTAELAADTEPEAQLQVFQQSMAALWSRYQDLMTERVEALQQAATAIATNTTLTEATQAAAVQAAHKLAGVLGMFGRHDGTVLARQIETALNTDLHDQDTEAARLQVPDQVEALIQLLDLPTTPTTLEPELLLPELVLVSKDQTLATELQALAATANLSWEVITASTQAYASCQQQRPELVVLDIVSASQWLADLDLLKHLAATSPPVPTIVLTAMDSLVDRVAIAQTGIQRLLVKPVTPNQVWDVAQTIYQQSRFLKAQILVVDDDPIIIRALRSLLEPWGMQVTGLENPQTFWDVLNTSRPDLLILDVEMPEFSGIDLCQAVRTDPDWQNLPILFLTAHTEAPIVQKIYGVGADDYISKPLVGPELLTRILNRLERNRLLQQLSNRDAITGLPNYGQSQQALDQFLALAQQNSQPLAIAILSLSELSPIKIKHGHTTGQQILRRWGECLQLHHKGQEVIGYWGQGEFVIGALDLNQQELADYLAPLLNNLRRQIITAPNGERLQPSFDVAIAEFPTHGNTLQMLYQAAVQRLESQLESQLEPQS
ncbi:MAG: response regulator [Cyanobacteria bacterium P01_H01_bin.121]